MRYFVAGIYKLAEISKKQNAFDFRQKNIRFAT